MQEHDPASNPPSEADGSSRELSIEERRALDRLCSAAFDELSRIARSTKRSRFNPAVSTGTLISEAWLRLVQSRGFAQESKGDFLGIASSVMRQVLTQAARRRETAKRGGGVLTSGITFDPDSFPVACDRDLLALDSALTELQRHSPRQAKIVEERFFGGFEESEIAARLNVSVSTVSREWRSAKAWLAVEARRQR